MGDREESAAPVNLVTRRLTRRAVLRLGAIVAALPLAAACGGQPSAPAPAPKTEAKPTEAAKPAAPAAATAAPKTEAKPGEAAKPATQAAGVPKAKIDGKLSVIIDADFYPEHNAFIERKVKEFAEQQGYPLDFSTVASFVGAANISQKLSAAVQAGDPPDVITHTEKASALKFLEVIEDVDSLQKEIIGQYGKVLPAFEQTSLLDGKFWAVNHFSRAGGYWVREEPLKAAGIDFRKDLEDWDKVREAVLKASQPEKELWGWGLTVNRSGDGDSIVREQVFSRGGQLTDETGQVVVLNKDPYREYTIAALDQLKEIYTDPKWARMIPPGVNSWTDPSNNEAYLAGRLVYTSNAGTMFAKAVVDKNPVAEDTYLVPKPKGLGPSGRSLQGADGMNFFIMKGAKNREASEQMIQFLMTPDVYREMFRISIGYVYPAHQWGWDEKILVEDKYAQHVTDAWKKVAFDPSGYTAGEWPGPPSAHVASLESSNFWTDMMGEIINGAPVETALKNGHDKAVRVFKEFGAKGA